MKPQATTVYTGITSASFRKQLNKKLDSKDDKSSKQSQLRPAAEIVNKAINQLRTEIGLELANLINADTNEKDVKSIVIGLRLADQKMASLSLRINNLLRLPKSKALEDEV